MIKKVTKEEKGKPALAKATAGKYFEAVGRRKTAVARVRLFPKSEGIIINGKDYKLYFPMSELQNKIEAPFKLLEAEPFQVSVKVKGGGLNAQAEAIRHGISRALLLFNQSFKKRLRTLGFLTRDSRMKERKKYGLKGARRAPQWSKR